jgi:succinyl-CoA synthetase beta subunit
MDLYEHQGKELFAESGIPVLPSELVRSVEEGRRAAGRLGRLLAVKAQVLRGGRGKAGGVRIVRDGDELEQALAALLGMTIGGQRVESVLLEQGVDIAREFYLALALDRAAKKPLLLFSTRGGIDIEQVAREEPQALRRLHIDPLTGLQEFQLRDLGFWARFSADERRAFADIARAAWRLFRDKDATLVEINPLCQEQSGRFMPLDAKVTIDNNALPRHPELERLTGFSPLQGVDDPRERRARQAGVAYVGLDGDIGILSNGAGMVMSVLDQVVAGGGRPADFLDLGGGARLPQIAAALELILSDPDARVILVTVFGGITRCDEVARGLLAALQDNGARVPVVVRLVGTNAEEGRALLEGSGRADLHPMPTLSKAIAKAVELAREREGAGAGRPGSGESAP